MKKLFVLLAISYLTITGLIAQSIKLNKGDEFSYRTSIFEHKDIKSTENDLVNKYESFNSQQISFKVVEALQHQYKLTAKVENIQNYERRKSGKRDQWQTGGSFHQLIKNENTLFYSADYQLEMFLTDMVEDKQIKITNVECVNEEYKLMFPDSTLIEKYEKSIKGLFLVNQKKLKKGRILKLEKQAYIVSDTKDNVLMLSSVEEKNEPQYLLKYDLKSGLLLERNIFVNSQGHEEKVLYVDPQKEDFTNRTDERKIERTNLIVINKEPYYTHKYQKNEHVKDSTLLRTNVTIRGKILNPTSDRNVAIEWAESVPNAYNKYCINTTLADDNTFELRLFIDKLQKVAL